MKSLIYILVGVGLGIVLTIRFWKPELGSRDAIDIEEKTIQEKKILKLPKPIEQNGNNIKKQLTEEQRILTQVINNSPKPCDFEIHSREDINELYEKRNELNVLIEEKSKEQYKLSIEALNPLEKEQVNDLKNKIKILQINTKQLETQDP